jgi:putative restriction endonuclease
LRVQDVDFEHLISGLPEQHRQTLQWFIDHAGQVTRWPEPIAPGLFLATRAKGIYKPQWSKYALSVRQNLDGTYPDRDPKPHKDGTWAYPYFQEGDNLENPESTFTNAALFNCWRDGVPVGVIRQVTRPSLIQRT